MLANAPPLVYIYMRTRELRGPAYWFSPPDDPNRLGAVLWAIGNGGPAYY